LVRQGDRTIPTVCREMDLSETAVRRWVERAAVDVTATIRAIHAASGGQYGVPRVLAELRGQGHDVGRKRVARRRGSAGVAHPAGWHGAA